jgi:hypothetical protein
MNDSDDRKKLLDIISREVGAGVYGRDITFGYGFRLLKWRRELRSYFMGFAGPTSLWLSDMSSEQLLDVLQRVRSIKKHNADVQALIDRELGRTHVVVGPSTCGSCPRCS